MNVQVLRQGLTAGLIAAGLVAGCAGKYETQPLDLKFAHPAGQAVEAGSAKIVVVPFEDRRMNKGRVGTRTHLWGGETYFKTSREQPAEVFAKVFTDRLKSRAWGDRAWNARQVPAGTTTDADIVISGQVLEFSAQAKSRMFSTVLTTTSRLALQAKNLSDGSVTSRTVDGSRSRTVFWFSEDDVQALLADTMMDGIERFISDTAIVQKALRPAH